MRKLYIVGFPGMYGGAGTELHHQIRLWSKIKDIEIHIIPTSKGYLNEPLMPEMISLGAHIHESRVYGMINNCDAVINFCSKEFLEDLEEINKHTNRVMWVNCMTFLFDKEKADAHKGLISHYLYQRYEVMEDHNYRMSILGRPPCETMVFKPYFDKSSTVFSPQIRETTNIGRISRQDLDKFAENTLHIYEYIVSPKMKRGHFLGYSDNVSTKIGIPFDWIKTYRDQSVLPVRDFYKTVDFIVQPTNTMENLPRVGFEAMYSGVPLIVDNRGGWTHLVDHGVTGFLCNTQQEFIYYGSKLAFEEDFRIEMAGKALTKAIDISGEEESLDSWMKVFESVFN